MSRPSNEGCPSRYKKEIQAIRRLEGAIDLDPNLTLVRKKLAKDKTRALIDDLGELVTVSKDADDLSVIEGTSIQKRRGRDKVGARFDQKKKVS